MLTVPSIEGCKIETTTEFTTPDNQALYSYWRDLHEKSPELGPQISQFELTDIIELTPKIIYKELEQNGADFSNRFWGTACTKAFGRDSTGQSLGDIYNGPLLSSFLNLAHFILSNVHAVRVSGKLEFIESKEYKDFEASNMPLFDEYGRATRIITLYDFEI